MMSRKRTTIHVPWEDVVHLVTKMRENGNRLHLFARIQSYLGLRAKDVLSLTWGDVLDNTELSLKESKTGKVRRLILNEKLKQDVLDEYNLKFGNKKKDLIFLNRFGTSAVSLSFVNRQFKAAFKKYGLDSGQQISTHCFRKSFAYKILEDNDFSEKSIFTISRLFNHSSVKNTMLYLLLDQKEADDIYKSLSI